MYKVCPITGISTEGLGLQVLRFLAYNVPATRASYVSPVPSDHGALGQVTISDIPFQFRGYFDSPRLRVQTYDVEILCLEASMMDSGLTEYFHPVTKQFVPFENKSKTGFTLADLLAYAPPPEPYKINALDQEQALSVVFSTFTQMVQLDSHTALKWAEEFLKETGEDFDYEDCYNIDNVKKAVKWAVQKKNKGS